MARAIKMTAAAIVGLGASVLAYRYLSADMYERACGLANLFKADYSREVEQKIEIKYEESDILIDFTRLTDWKTVCVTDWYDGELVALRGQGLPQRAYWIGKSQCGGDPSKTVSALFVRPDGGALARNLRLSELQIKFSFGGYEGGFLPPGFDQCAHPRDAVARCAWIGSPGGHCLLLFPTSEGGLRWSNFGPGQ